MPSKCEFAGRVEDETKVERPFHRAFEPYRRNKKRKFFSIEADQAIALLELMVVEDVTPQIAEQADQVDPESKSASEELQRRNGASLSSEDFLAKFDGRVRSSVARLLDAARLAGGSCGGERRFSIQARCPMWRNPVSVAWVTPPGEPTDGVLVSNHLLFGVCEDLGAASQAQRGDGPLGRRD